MKRFIGGMCMAILATSLGAAARPDDDPKVVIDKAIKALGGEEKLSAAKAVAWKSKTKIRFMDNEIAASTEVTAQGLNHYCSEFSNDMFQGVTVIHGDKGWRKFGEMVMELDKDGVNNEKRNAYLQLLPIVLVPLKGKDFKLAATPDEKVDGKAAAGVKVTGPDGKDFTLYFDKESGLPVLLVAKVIGFTGEEYTQQTTFGGYKDFGGIKKATKIENKREGTPFIEQEITEFKAMDKADPKKFEEPK